MPREFLEVPRRRRGAARPLARAGARDLGRAVAYARRGGGRIRGKTCAIQRRLFGGERIELDRPAPRAERAVGPALAVLYDDADCLVVAKPPSSRGALATGLAVRRRRRDRAR
jgi:23S rRNA pseudouridine1911/1915/1917 synthase